MDDIKAIRDALAEEAKEPRFRDEGHDWEHVAYPERIARLLDALELAQRENELRRELVSTGNRMVQELEAKLGAAQKDAERYRWLRTFNVDSYMACGMLNDLDAEIDAAMAASAPESPSAAQSTP